MAVIANTYKTYEEKGIREDLSDVIYNISPSETPFMSRAGKGDADNTYFEWQQDALASPNTGNAQLEGDDVSAFDAVTPTVRLGNYQQISRKTLIVSGTAERVKKAGRKSERAYQIAKKGKELKIDMEAIMLANQAANAGAAGTARVTGGMGAWVKTNTDKGATGADPVYTTAPTATRTDGTQRAVSETILKSVVQKCFNSGASPDTIMVGSSQKQAISGFSGIATRNLNKTAAESTAIVAAADVYVSDFGNLSIIPNRFQRARDGWVLDFEYIKVAYLRPFDTEDLAKTGDAEKAMLIVEYGLQVLHEAAQGLMADLS